MFLLLIMLSCVWGACASCDIYSAGIEGCAVCSTASVCTECTVGYYLHTDDQCYRCLSTLSGCGVCSSSSVCTYCLPGYYLNGNTCSTCDGAIQGCQFCDDISTCLECHSDYYLTGGNCVSCTNIANCLKCSSSSDCLQCVMGYYRDNSNTCQSCPANCLACNSNTDCTSCGVGYYISAGACTSCSANCLACDQSGSCISCVEGTYLSGGTCTACASPCSTCTSSACLSCQSGYLNAGSCETCAVGCKVCSDASTCSVCESTHTLVGAVCNLCESLVQGCYICSDSSTCTTCLSGFYVNAGSCSPCEDAMPGCQLCSSSSVCLECENGYYENAGSCDPCSNSMSFCLRCSDSSHCTTCIGGYFVNSTSNACSLCHDQIPNCIGCAHDTLCLLCQQNYTVSGGVCVSSGPATPIQVYSFCQINHCLSCDHDSVTDTVICTNCIPTHYLDGSGVCQSCSGSMAGCQKCSSSLACEGCMVGYHLNAGSCSLCSSSMEGCTLCDTSSNCLECESGYYVDAMNTCTYCSNSLNGCTKCSDSSTCVECRGGYYLNSNACDPCSLQSGCLFCDSSINCMACATTFYLESGVCQSCSVIENCFHCSSNLICTQCKSGYNTTTEGQCEEIRFDFSGATTPQVDEMSLSLKTYYISQTQLKHILFVKGTYFTHNDVDWHSTSTLTLNGPEGEILLTVTSVEWGDNHYTLIFYTDNPYRISYDDIAKMQFTRRLLDGSVGSNYVVQLDMNQNALQSILPSYSHSGDLRIDYSLNKPEFVATVVRGVNLYWYHLFGIIVVCILFIKFLIKALFSVPKSGDMGQITPHILAVKCGALILFPTYIQYFDYCSGFMVADLPWINSIVGNALANQSDVQPFAYAVYYNNMNFASMYLLAFSVCLLLGLVALAVFKKVGDSDRLWSSYQFLYCFFIFGLTFAGCASLQGAIMNPLNSIDANATFYIIGIFLYFLVFLDCAYSLKKAVVNIWKVRIFMKATILSLAHFNPVFLIAMLLFADVTMIIFEYRWIRSKPKFEFLTPYPKLWLVNNLLAELALGLIILLPAILLGILIVSIIIGYLICSEFFFHYTELRNKMKVNDEKKENAKESNSSQQFSQVNLKQTKKNKESVNGNIFMKTEEPMMENEDDVNLDKTILFSGLKRRKQRKRDLQLEEKQEDVDFIVNEEISVKDEKL